MSTRTNWNQHEMTLLKGPVHEFTVVRLVASLDACASQNERTPPLAPFPFNAIHKRVPYFKKQTFFGLPWPIAAKPKHHQINSHQAADQVIHSHLFFLVLKVPLIIKHTFRQLQKNRSRNTKFGIANLKPNSMSDFPHRRNSSRIRGDFSLNPKAYPKYIV